MTGQRGASGPVQRGALATGLRMLELLVSAHGPLGVTETADQLSLDKANARTAPWLPSCGSATWSRTPPPGATAPPCVSWSWRDRSSTPRTSPSSRASPQVALGCLRREHAPRRAGRGPCRLCVNAERHDAPLRQRRHRPVWPPALHRDGQGHHRQPAARDRGRRSSRTSTSSPLHPGPSPASKPSRRSWARSA